MTIEILSATATARFLGFCEKCDRPIAADLDGHAGSHANIACPDCKNLSPAERLYATETAVHCNAACEGAIGPDCSCACGGINHGGVWVEEIDMIASLVESDRERRAKVAEKARKRREAARVARQDSFTLWGATHEDVTKFLADDSNVGWSTFLSDLADQVATGKELSERQVECVRDSIARQVARDEARARDLATRPAPIAPPIGARNETITGTVTSTSSQPAFQGSGLVYKMTARDDRGFRVTGTLPRSLQADYSIATGTEVERVKTGDRVTFVAGEITAAAWCDDEDLGSFKRPKNAQRLTDQLVAA